MYYGRINILALLLKKQVHDCRHTLDKRSFITIHAVSIPGSYFDVL